MTTAVPKERTVEALAEVWASLGALLRSLDATEWRAATALAGWDVQANVAHVIGTEAMLLDVPAPDVAVDRQQSTHVRNDIGAFNEAWVVALADASPQEMLSTYDDHISRRLAALRAMDQQRWDAETFTPAGRDSYGRFMRIRVFDCWMHEQDIRRALERPGHESGPAVHVALDEMAAAMGYVVGKRAAAPDGARVQFELGERQVERTILVEVGERAALVEALSGPPTVALSMPVGVFAGLAGGRVAAADVVEAVTITGDVSLGGAILENLAFTI